MITMNISIPKKKLKKDMGLYPEINWSVVALEGIHRQLKVLKEKENFKQKDIGRNKK